MSATTSTNPTPILRLTICISGPPSLDNEEDAREHQVKRR
jgi:hypothetical protein